MKYRKRKFKNGFAWCFKCSQWLFVELFSERKNRLFFVETSCKKCINERRRINNNSDQPTLHERRDAMRNGVLWCFNHKRFEKWFLFGENKARANGRKAICKKCRRAKRIAKKQKEQQGFAD